MTFLETLCQPRQRQRYGTRNRNYWTIRRRIDELIAELGLEATPIPKQPKPPVEKFWNGSNGEITPEEARQAVGESKMISLSFGREPGSSALDETVSENDTFTNAADQPGQDNDANRTLPASPCPYSETCPRNNIPPLPYFSPPRRQGLKSPHPLALPIAGRNPSRKNPFLDQKANWRKSERG